MVGENFVALVAEALADSVLTAKHFGGAAMTGKGQNRVINAHPVQVIEPPKADEAPQVEAADHSMIIPPLSRSGFSKRRF